MNNRKMLWIMPLFLLTPIAWSLARAAQGGPARTVPVRILVSVEARHDKEVPTIKREDVRVLQGNNRLQVTDWVPMQGDRANLELFVVLDDASDTAIGLQFDDLRQFMNAQPATTAIAVAYMHFGTVEIVQNLTKDHAQAGKALRLPFAASINPSPYLSVSDLIGKWPESSARREILLISSGIDRLYGGPNDPYLLQAIERAQRAGIQIYALHASAQGHLAHSLWRLRWGQYNLSQLTEETGGEFYTPDIQTVSFKPFLDQFADRLQHQYQLTFLAIPEQEAGYQRILLDTEVPNAELVAADKVYVPLPR
jgi:hypothetical protein